MKAGDARVLLTGATGGIGRAAAEALLRKGASLMLVGRSPATLSECARRLTHHLSLEPSRVAWHAADVMQPKAVASLADEAIAFGANVIVHGAGSPAFGAFESLDPAGWQASIQTNLVAPMSLTQALLPRLRTQSRAQVVFVGSVLGRLGVPGYAAYCASKFGLRGFAEALRRELGDGPVKVQYLGPRGTSTPFNSDEVVAYNLATDSAMDEPATVADALVALIEDESAERFLGFPESLAVRVNGIVPAWLDGAFAKHRRALAAPAPSASQA